MLGRIDCPYLQIHVVTGSQVRLRSFDGYKDLEFGSFQKERSGVSRRLPIDVYLQSITQDLTEAISPLYLQTPRTHLLGHILSYCFSDVFLCVICTVTCPVGA